MASTLDKIKRLERSLAQDASDDPVLDSTIDKLLAREIFNVRNLQTRLQDQLSLFEAQYKIKSDVFYKQFQDGDLGDDMDFIEWASTVEMMETARQRLSVLEQDA